MPRLLQGPAKASKIPIASLFLLLYSCANVFAASPAPAAVPVPVGQTWYGYDGNWSPVSIRVGSPPQWLDVLVSTQNRETWVVGVGGCDGTSICRDKRGGLFRSNTSSTWQEVGFYELGLDPQLGFAGYANYGYDNVDLSDQIIVPSQIVGAINTTDHWLGFLGLGLALTNFTNVDKLPFLSSMVENQSLIPSHSYGYTAGAYHRLKHVPASLTLGGYDANRFKSHNVSFDLDPNQNPVAAINEITMSAQPLSTSSTGTGWFTNPLTLLGPGDADLFTIDSSTPFLWLPETVCTRFEKALGLIYDTNLQLYTFGSNASQHEALINWNMTFNFAIADLPGSAKVVNITLPYSAFDLQLSYPFPGLNATSSSPAINYFPLRKAANSSQYTIGRSFLQEAYLIVDYERNNFSVHQATFATDALTNYNLVNINNSTLTGHGATTSSSLGKGAIAGIVIACVIVVVSIAVTLIFCLRGRQRTEQDEKQPQRKPGLHWFSREPKEEPPNELLGATQHPVEVPANHKIIELEASTPQELQGSEVIKDDAHVSAYGPAPRSRNLTLTLPCGHDANHPVELEHNNGQQQEYYGPEPSPLTPPAYSPSRVGRGGNSHTTTSGEVPRESSPMTTPRLSPLTPMQLVSPLACMSPQLNRHVYRDDHRGVRSAEEDGTGAHPPVSAVSEVRQYQRYSWEDER